MAATTHIAAPARADSPLALWHLLSLDAPTVASLWTWFIARSAGVHLPIASITAMALAVWILYAADRLLDARVLEEDCSQNCEERAFAELEARHYFHHGHRRVFVTGIALASLMLGEILRLLDPVAMRLYLAEGGLLAAWFLILHTTRCAHRLPKEIAVGIFFSAAVFVPTIARNPGVRPELAIVAVLFGALCSLNCLFIYAWEHTDVSCIRAEGLQAATLPHPTTRFALCRLPSFAIAALFFATAIALKAHDAARMIAAVCGLSLALLLVIHRNRSQLSRVHLRAVADAALLTPVLALPVLRFMPR